MRVLKYGALAASFGLVLGLLTLAGCSGGATTGGNVAKDGDKDDDKGGDKGETKRTAVTGGDAVIVGTVKFTGEMPDTSLPEAATKSLAGKPDEEKHCLNDKASPYEKGAPQWHINKDNKGVEYAVVFLKPESGTFFACGEDDDAYKAKVGSKDKHTDATLHQPFCAFIPNSVVVFSKYRDKDYKFKSTGQNLLVYNDTDAPKVDKGIPHNTKITNPKGNEVMNKSISPGDHETVKDLPPEGQPYQVSCSIHPWMSANLWVLDHPYFAVTDKDGKFKIENAPVGKVRLVVWHAAAGTLNGKDGESIETKKGETVTKDYEAKAK